MPLAGRTSRIVSGGQTGVDRAALDVALAHGIDCGGWVPCGRRAEDGRISPRYPMRETPGAAYVDRTRRNVRDSDGTLVLLRGEATGGTALTLAIARQMRRPCLPIDLDAAPAAAVVQEWLTDNGICVLNIAGPRESTQPGIYAQAAAFLEEMLTAVGDAAVSTE